MRVWTQINRSLRRPFYWVNKGCEMEVIWKKPSEYPQVDQGQDIKVWGVVDFHFYRCEYGGLGDDGKAIRTATLEKVSRQVVELRFANTEAKKNGWNITKNMVSFQQMRRGGLMNGVTKMATS